MFLVFWIFDNFENRKHNHKNYFPKKSFIYLDLRTNYVWKNTYQWRGYKIPSRSVENGRILPFWTSQKGAFHAIRIISTFFRVSFFPDLDRLGSVLGHFCIYYKNLTENMYRTTQTPNLRFNLSWPRDLGWYWLDTSSPMASAGT